MRIETDELLRARERGAIQQVELPKWLKGEGFDYESTD